MQVLENLDINNVNPEHGGGGLTSAITRTTASYLCSLKNPTSTHTLNF